MGGGGGGGGYKHGMSYGKCSVLRVQMCGDEVGYSHIWTGGGGRVVVVSFYCQSVQDEGLIQPSKSMCSSGVTGKNGAE